MATTLLPLVLTWSARASALSCGNASLPPGTAVRSSGCCREPRSGAVVPCSAVATPFGHCAGSRSHKVNPPQYHVMDPFCDENDPNAPFFDPMHGIYHLFYQKHCAAPVPGEAIKGIVYGHVVSRDLVMWAHLPVAIWNDQPYDSYAIYSGSATIVNGTPHVIYPGLCLKRLWPADSRAHWCTNFVDAVPADHTTDPLLRKWTKPLYNPIVNGSAKDPSAAWKTAAGEWRFSSNAAEIFSTTDWISWRSLGTVAALPQGDCPSLLPLPRTTPGSGPAPPGHAPTPTHVHITSGSPYKTWMQVGRYVDGGVGAPGKWEPLRPCLLPAGGKRTSPGGCGQCTDTGQTYAAKNFFDPVGNRTLLWTWAGVVPNATMALLREMTWNAELQQLQFAPLEEQTRLRGRVLATRARWQVPARSDIALACNASQSETEVVFRLPQVHARFGVVVMRGFDGDISAQTGGFFWIDYSPELHSATVGYVSRGNSTGQTKAALARVMPGVNLRGMDLKVLSGYNGNWSECQAICDATVACEAWTWCIRCPDTSKCCLKSGIPAPTQMVNSSARYDIVSGVKSPLLVDQCPMGANHSECTPTDTLQLAPAELTVSVRVFADKTFAEAYFQQGRVVITASTPLSSPGCVSVATSSAAVVVHNVTVWTVNSIWTSPESVLATPRHRLRTHDDTDESVLAPRGRARLLGGDGNVIAT